ncbi:hypothetical protein FGG08_006203 [Glutinoglossum americanum]|uniref:Ankyrin repeat protein n=1 Tax=Glutinoglossum americanum TaxID=1670608 RepID=A0A9P8L268_9PEZI|nr:hypothetical protein FGG08_006203 [Glutinoglossum americanum]
MPGKVATGGTADHPICSLEHATPEPADPPPVAGGSYTQPVSVRAATLYYHEIWFIKLAIWRGPLFAQHWHRDRKPTFGPLSCDQSCGIGVSFVWHYSPFSRAAFTASFMRKFKQSWVSPSLHWNISLPRIVANDSEIMEFASLGNIEAMVRLFRSGKASPTDITPQGNSLLHIAVRSNHLEVCKRLLLEGVDANAAGQDGEHISTPLHVAISRTQSYDIARLLMRNGADPGNCNSSSETALHTFFNDTVRKTLLYHGEIVESDLRDSRGMTPLHFVTWSSKSTVDAVRRIVERGECIDAMLKDNEGRSTLHFAAQRGNIAVVEYLMGLGTHMDVRCRDRYGRTVLHYAVESRRTETINKLAERGADVRAKDSRGRTVLHHAAWRGNLEAAKRLIELGAGEDVLSRDTAGMTPSDLAAEQGKTPVANFLSDFATRLGGNMRCRSDERLAAACSGERVRPSGQPNSHHQGYHISPQLRMCREEYWNNEYCTSRYRGREHKESFSSGGPSSVPPKSSFTFRESLGSNRLRTVSAARWLVLAAVLMSLLYLRSFK